MTMQFILGRSGSGKSEYCLNAIRSELKALPDGDPIVLLVPEQASFLAEYALVTTPGLTGTVRAQVLSFRRLAHRILQETGGIDRQPLDETGKKMLLYRILEQRKAHLRSMKLAGPVTGYVDAMLELIRELKRYDHAPEQLAALTERADALLPRRTLALSDKLHDLRLVYGEYERLLASSYVDGDDMFPLAADKLAESPTVRRTQFWIDGFHGFTPQERKLVEGLMRFGAGVRLTLCLDRPYGPGEQPHELDLYHPTAVTMSKLRQRADELQIPVLDTVRLPEPALGRFRSSPMLAHLEKHFHRPRPWTEADDANAEGTGFGPSEGEASAGPGMPAAGGGGVSGREGSLDEQGGGARRGLGLVPGPPLAGAIRVYAAANRRAEVEGVAREIVRLAREEGFRWREMAVMVRDADGYIDLVARIFEDYGIPGFLDQKRAVTHHPLVEFVRSALDVVHGHWRYDSVFRCVKTGFFEDAGQELGGAMDELENYVLAFGIHGSRWTSPERWTYRLNDSFGMEAAAKQAEDDAAAEPAYLARIHESRMAVVGPLAAFERRLRGAADARAIVEAMYALLEDVRAAEKLERWSEAALMDGNPEKAREHVQVWSSLMDALDQIVEVLDDEPVGTEAFIGILDAGLEGLRLGLVPPALDQVLIGSPERTRAAHVRCCFVLGVNDGIYPAKMPESGILTEQERDQLAAAGFELAPGSRRRLLDEQFLIYSTFTLASERLWLSYPLADEEGKALRPSETIRRVKRLFPRIKEAFIHMEPLSSMGEAEQADYAARPLQAMSHLLVQLRHWTRGTEISPVWWDVYNWLADEPAWRRHLGIHLYGLFYTNEERPLSADTSRSLYGAPLRASVSRMEKYAACPFAHFASYGLRLRQRRVYRLEAPDVGQLFHAALGLLALELREERIGWGELTREDCERRAADIVDRLAPGLQSRILLSSGRHQYISRKLKAIVGRASVVLGEHARKSDFVPVGLEVAFGPDAELPPLTFTLDNGVRMEIVGRIDRVDRAETEGGLLVRILDYKSSRTALRMSDVYYGLSLQMLTYLDVVLTHAEQWLGQAARPAGVLYFHVHQPLLQTKNALPPDDAEEERLRRYQMKGLVTADPKTVFAMDHALAEGRARSNIIPVALKKDGGFYAYSSIVEPAQWERLRRYVRTVIRAIGQEIVGGRVDVAPYREGAQAACRFCEYKAVCQFDPAVQENAYRRLKSGGGVDWLALMEAAAADAEEGGERRDDETGHAE